MKTFYCIISTSDGFVVEPVSEDDGESISQAVATYSEEVDAEAGLKRAKELEKKLRPLWQAAIEHSYRVRDLMLATVYEAALPLAIPGD